MEVAEDEGEKTGLCSITGVVTSIMLLLPPPLLPPLPAPTDADDVSGRVGSMEAENPGAKALAPRNVLVDLLRPTEREGGVIMSVMILQG